MAGNSMLIVPNTPPEQFGTFIDGLKNTPSYGLHNPYRNIERYNMLGKVSAKVAEALSQADIADYFATLIQRVMPKSYAQCIGEVTVTRDFFYNFAGDNPRFHFGRGFSVTGNHDGQRSNGYRWPHGAVVIITPFNFPLEIPALQIMGALLTGNRPLVKSDSKVSVVTEQFIRLLIACGLPTVDIDLIHCSGENMGRLLKEAERHIDFCQFTGSSEVGEYVMQTLKGRVKLEDSGFNWKIIGRDVPDEYLEYIAWQCDHDAYAASGQKCSAQSLLFVHKWQSITLEITLKKLAKRRSLSDLTVGPLLSVNNEQIYEHIAKILTLHGTCLNWGGNPLTLHTIPACYGAYEPTAISVPISLFCVEQQFELLTKEIFGPFQLIVEYNDEQVDTMLEILERVAHHLTAAVVSNDQEFIGKVLGATKNGTTYVGLRARTTGAPQNHFFGPCGPTAAGIGTPESIIATWTAHREVVFDTFPPSATWILPDPS
ncbi:MAG: 1-pyrroline-5-carboxylate dehydrogenase [Parcubacteria group bacterium Greene1014_15]|nr:MAG: 1-pyrroline-5-carboxylate dehydrogenase [Parcubacteria group bacterium Greene1014_15]